MSLLVRAALLGGLAYVVSRAVKASRYPHQTDAQRLSRSESDEPIESETWPTSEQPSTSTY